MKIYVGNLSHATTDAQLRTAFEVYGTVTRADVGKDLHFSLPRGFGFVDMPVHLEGVAAVYALHGDLLCGMKLRVSEAKYEVGRPAVAPDGPGGTVNGVESDLPDGHLI